MLRTHNYGCHLYIQLEDVTLCQSVHYYSHMHCTLFHLVGFLCGINIVNDKTCFLLPDCYRN